MYMYGSTDIHTLHKKVVWGVASEDILVILLKLKPSTSGFSVELFNSRQ